MSKFLPADAYPPEPALSPNRAALAEHNAMRAEAAAQVAELQARLNRLEALKAELAPIEAELAALDAVEADALAAWSATPEQPAPTPDLAAREAIVARLSAARQQVAGAEIATASVSHVLTSANHRAAEFERATPALIAAVMLDEARALVPSIIETAGAFARAKGRYESLRKFLLTRAEAASDVAANNGFFRDLETLDHYFADAIRQVPMLSFNADAEWKSLAADLGDVPATLTLGTTSHFVDPIAAEAASVAAFPSTSRTSW